jgi:hypothetical protein
VPAARVHITSASPPVVNRNGYWHVGELAIMRKPLAHQRHSLQGVGEEFRFIALFTRLSVAEVAVPAVKLSLINVCVRAVVDAIRVAIVCQSCVPSRLVQSEM